jgi:hypothetical protein
MAGKGYDKFSQIFITLSSYLPVILLARCFGDSKTEPGTIFGFIGLIEAIKDFFLIFFKY